LQFYTRPLPIGRVSIVSISATATLAALVGLSLVLFSNGEQTTTALASPSQQTRYFAETGYTVSNSFLGFFDRYGGVRTFGYPMSDQMSENGRPVQYFERQRFEYHAEHAGTDHEVQLSRFGAMTAPAHLLSAFSAPFAPRPNQVFMPETRHSLSYSFLDFWRANGGVRILGYPVTEPVSQHGSIVQYFERARMEYHPEKAGQGYGVELGLLGKEYLAAHPDIAARISPGRAASTSSRGADAPPARNEPAAPAGLSSKEDELLQRINDARRAAGVSPVSLDGSLRSLSLSRSQDMVNRNYFSHTTPDGTGFLSILKSANVPYRYAGEIIANNNYGDGEAALSAYNGFMNSPQHRQIMLDGRFTHAGVGEATNAKGFHFFTVIFVQK
jgi:uncharacterized protein YkwD